MNIRELIDKNLFTVINSGSDTGRILSKPYCCDLLSVAMSSAPADGIWFTVMANLNTLAVAALTDTACVVLCQNASLDEAAQAKAREEGITVLATELPVFDAALLAYRQLAGSSSDGGPNNSSHVDGTDGGFPGDGPDDSPGDGTDGSPEDGPEGGSSGRQEAADDA